MTDLDALAVQVGREAVAQVVRDEPGQQPSPETIACVLAGRLDDRQAPRFAILGARAMLAKLRELGLVVESGTIAIPHNREPTAADFPTAYRPIRSITSNGTGHD